MKVLSIEKFSGHLAATSANEVVFISGKNSFIATFAGVIPEGAELKAVKKALLFSALHQKNSAECAEGKASVYKALKVDVIGTVSAISLKNVAYIVDGKTLFKGLIAPVGAVVDGETVRPEAVKHIEKSIFERVKAFEKASRLITVENLNNAITEAEAEAETETPTAEAPKAKEAKAKAKA